MTEEFCPNCGHRKASSDPVKRGEWLLYPRQTLRKGTAVPIQPMQSTLLFELAKVGRTVPAEILGGWLSPEYFEPGTLARIQISKIRKALGRDQTPIETFKGQGYRWKDVP